MSSPKVEVELTEVSRFAPTKHRARMMAAVFFMQPLGQIAGNLVSLVVVSISRKSKHEDMLRSVDIMWRWIIGLGVIPGVIALLFRFALQLMTCVLFFLRLFIVTFRVGHV